MFGRLEDDDPTVWNSLSDSMKKVNSLNTFQQCQKALSDSNNK